MKLFLQQREPMVFAHWHGDELALIQLVHMYPTATIVSTSKDGELMNTAIKLLGGKTARGSSTRGGIGALKGLLNLMKSGYNASFAVDGPRGPLYQVKPGVFEVSRLMQAPIFAVGVACDRSWRFPKSWNKTFVPKPFSTVSIYWKGPIGPTTKGQDPRSKELAQSLAQSIFDCREEAVKHL
jgi:lysophospholipid acyltransferase (LPLAT)-like uncharacterized protein